jgi:hypothetical protein
MHTPTPRQSGMLRRWAQSGFVASALALLQVLAPTLSGDARQAEVTRTGAGITYQKLPNTDFSGHTRPGGWEKRTGTPESCGPGDGHGKPLPPCNTTYLEQACANLCGCAGFNSNGWLKSCSATQDGCQQKHLPGTDAYVGSALGGAKGCEKPPPPPGPSPGPPPPGACPTAATASGPMPGPVEDYHYPEEEPAERATMLLSLPTLVSAQATSNSSGTASLKSGSATASVSVGKLAFGSWQLVAFMQPAPLTAAEKTVNSPASTAAGVVLERRFARWSTLLYLTAGGVSEPILLRSGIGDVSAIHQPSYNFSDPCYFQRATRQPQDYLGQHLLNKSNFSEPSFVDAAALLTPPHDYKLIGKTDSYFKWSVTQDGFIKRYLPGTRTTSRSAGFV